MGITCVCYSVYKEEILSLIKDGYNTVSLIGELCNAGTQCGGCVAYIIDMIEEDMELKTKKRNKDGYVML